MFPFRKHLLSSTIDKASFYHQKRLYTVRNGSLSDLAPMVRSYVEEKALVCDPDSVYLCDGSEKESKLLIETLLKDKMIQPLPKYDNW